VKKLAGVIENYSKFEVCMVVTVVQAEGVNQREIHRKLVFMKPLNEKDQGN
jgi:hypothetical protein